MIAFFGNYQQAKNYARERGISLRELVLADAYPERLQGYSGRIEVVMAENYKRNERTQKIEALIGFINHMADIKEKANEPEAE